MAHKCCQYWASVKIDEARVYLSTLCRHKVLKYIQRLTATVQIREMLSLHQ